MPISRDNFDGGSVLTTQVLAVLKQDPNQAFSATEILGALQSQQATQTGVFGALVGLMARGEVEMKMISTTNGIDAFYAVKR